MQRILIIALAIILSGRPGTAAETKFDFSEARLNAAPAGFRSVVTGAGKPGDWQILLDDAPAALPALSPNARTNSKRPVLAQLSRDLTDEHFPLLIYDTESFGDFKLTTRFKIVDGQEEQMAGIAFRIQDEKNYFYFRASALSGTFAFFSYVNGNRSAPIAVKTPIIKGVWYELTIDCKGSHIRAWLNGKEEIPELIDGHFAQGKIGFWTKSDAVSYFADTKINYTPREPFAQTLVRDALKQHPKLLGLKVYASSTNAADIRLIASTDPSDIGQPAEQVERDVIARSLVFQRRQKDTQMVILPLHDSNGETIAAVQVMMKTFPGETEKTAITRALPIVKQMEARVLTAKDLTQ